MTDLNFQLREQLKEIDEDLEDLDYYEMELRFNNHIEGTEESINKLAFKKLRIEKYLINSLLKRNLEQSQRWYDLLIENYQDSIKLFKIDKLKVVDYDGKVIEEGQDIFLNKIMRDACKYKIYINFLKMTKS